MTDRELLKESRDVLERGCKHLYDLINKLPIEYFNLVDKGLYQGMRYYCNKIDSTLANTGNMDALELVDKIREMVDCNGSATGRPILRLRLTRTEAAALIDDYARRVPRAMLEEIEKQAFEYGKEQFLSYESIDAIAAKYGVKLEDSHEYP